MAFFQLLLFAFDIVHYFKRNWPVQALSSQNLKDASHGAVGDPGTFGKPGNRYRLTLPKQYHFQPAFEQALARVQKFKLPKLAILVSSCAEVFDAKITKFSKIAHY